MWQFFIAFLLLLKLIIQFFILLKQHLICFFVVRRMSVFGVWFGHRWSNWNIIIYFVWHKCPSHFQVFLRDGLDKLLVVDGNIVDGRWRSTLIAYIVEMNIRLMFYPTWILCSHIHVIILMLRYIYVLSWFNEDLMPLVAFFFLNLELLKTFLQILLKVSTQTIPKALIKINFGIQFILFGVVFARKDTFLLINWTLSLFFYAFFQEVWVHFEFLDCYIL